MFDWMVVIWNPQGRSQQQGSYLSIDDMSFDPSIDDISSGFQRSSRSSLDGTSVASAADFSTLSVTPSHRYPSNEEAQAAAEEAEAAEARSLSCASVISIEKEVKKEQSRISSSISTSITTTTTSTAVTKVTEYAVVHHQLSGVHQNGIAWFCHFPKMIHSVWWWMTDDRLILFPVIYFYVSFFLSFFLFFFLKHWNLVSSWIHVI